MRSTTCSKQNVKPAISSTKMMDLVVVSSHQQNMTTDPLASNVLIQIHVLKHFIYIYSLYTHNSSGGIIYSSDTQNLTETQHQEAHALMFT